MFEILPMDWNLKPILTQKWASVDMNWGGVVEPPTNPCNYNTGLLCKSAFCWLFHVIATKAVETALDNSNSGCCWVKQSITFLQRSPSGCETVIFKRCSLEPPDTTSWHSTDDTLTVYDSPRNFSLSIKWTRKPSWRWQTRATQKHAKIAPIRRVSFHFTEFHFPEFQITDA